MTGVKSLKLIVSSTKCSIWIDGIKVREVVTGVNTPSIYEHPLYIGSTAASGQFDGYISNLRISSIARSDEEMAYTGPLSADQYTTFYNPLTGVGGKLDHTKMKNIGSNTHAQIDTALTNAANHISNVTNPHGTTAAQVGAVPQTITPFQGDVNTLLVPGVYMVQDNATNRPAGENGGTLHVSYIAHNLWMQHLWLGQLGKIWTRYSTDQSGVRTWSAWAQVYPAVLT